MSLLLKNGQVVDYINRINEKLDIYISDGVIKRIGKDLKIDNSEEVDCENLIIIPGIFDMHVHLRDPGQTQKEDIFTGCEAAVAGGVTGMLCMPNTIPVLDSEEQVNYVLKKSKDAKAKIYITSSITKNLAGNELCDFKSLKRAGVIAVSDDGRPVKNARTMAQAMKKAETENLTIISHCEDLDIINSGIINDGKTSFTLGVPGMNRASENIITSREIGLARDYNTKIHIAHVSTKESVEEIRNAKLRGVMVTAETAPHYFTLTEDELLKRDANYRMNPPLREKNDVEAVIRGIMDGTVDTIATDHAPHTPEEKSDFLKAPNGVIGLETSLAVTLTALYHTKKLSLLEIVKIMCVNPRKILGLEGGEIAVNQIADITIFDKNKEWEINTDKLKSKSKNTCFKDIKFKGKVKYTIINGEIKYKSNEEG